MTKPLLERMKDTNVVVEAALAQRVNRYPYFRRVEGATMPRTRIEGRDFINLGSNNYLGLAADTRVIDAVQRATREWGAGVTGSRFLNGNLVLHEQLEARLANFFDREAALVYPTGYSANLGLLSSILRHGDHLVLDARVHASVFDGALLSRASMTRFAHNDPGDLRQALEARRGRAAACVVDGIYSMQGDAAPLAEIADVCDEYGCLLIDDEAHGLGVIGPTGAGVAEAQGVMSRVDAIVVTFSKSLGTCGGAIIGDSALLNAVRLTARPFLFTASNTPGALAAAIASLSILAAEPHLVDLLQARKCYLRDALLARGLDVPQSDGAVLTVAVGSDFRTLQAWQMLWNRGVYCNPIVAPAVPEGRGLLRLSVMCTHSEADLDEAAEKFEAILKIIAPTALV